MNWKEPRPTNLWERLEAAYRPWQLQLKTVMIADPEVVTVGGLKDALAPGGRPLAEKPTDPVKPEAGVTVTVYVVLLPEATF